VSVPASQQEQFRKAAYQQPIWPAPALDLAKSAPNLFAFYDLEPKPRYDQFKRFFDISLVVAMSPIVVPLCFLIGILIRLESKGPAIFKQKRAGQFGGSFQMYKFRSMRRDADASGALFASKGDKRVTRIGRMLRKYRLDELPQLLNVMKGEMSLIGPRPEQLSFVGVFESQIPGYSLRHLVKPGLTGLAQVHQGYCDSLEGTKNKLRYDLMYIKNRGPSLDIVIILKTIKTVLTGFGHR